MTAKEKDRKWPGLKNHEVFTEINGTRHIVCTFFVNVLIPVNIQKKPFLIDDPESERAQVLLESFILRTELPNGDIIEY